MRCPSCGTENAPDSRFCGGCGARLGATAQRVAPTQKISDDARFPQQPMSGGHGTQVAVQPVTPRPLPPAPYTVIPAGIAPPSAPPPRAISSAPPAVYAPLASTPPSVAVSPPRPRTQLDDPSMSMPMVARRPWGLIVVVLLIDVGLAVAGGLMLSRGIGDRATVAPRTGATVTPPSAVATGVTPSAAASPLAATASNPTPTPTGAAAPAPAADPAPATDPRPRPKPRTAPKPAPVSPETAAETTVNGSPIEVSISPAHGSTAPAPGGKRPSRRRPVAASKAGAPVDPYDTPAPGPDPLPAEAR